MSSAPAELSNTGKCLNLQQHSDIWDLKKAITLFKGRVQLICFSKSHISLRQWFIQISFQCGRNCKKELATHLKGDKSFKLKNAIFAVAFHLFQSKMTAVCSIVSKWKLFICPIRFLKLKGKWTDSYIVVFYSPGAFKAVYMACSYIFLCLTFTLSWMHPESKLGLVSYPWTFSMQIGASRDWTTNVSRWPALHLLTTATPWHHKQGHKLLHSLNWEFSPSSSHPGTSRAFASFYLPLNFPLMHLDAALCKQSGFSAMTLRCLPFSRRVSMLIIWITMPAVFPMSVVACTKLDRYIVPIL